MLPRKDSIAITGISGRYPNCSNAEELQKSLFAGTDLMTNNHNRWSHESLETSPRLGLVTDFDVFDAASFGINPKDANTYDPTLRKLLEVVFEAVVDAGLNPTELRGTKTGVFLALTKNVYSDVGPTGGIFSRSAAVAANMISHIFDFNGPSMAMDTACSGGLYALTEAVYSIFNDNCTMAVVCAAQSQFDPGESIELLIKYGVLHMEGKCRSFDLNRKGYAKSEAIVAVILQKVEESRRIYVTVSGVAANADGFKRDGIAHPSYQFQLAMLKDVYKKFEINPLEVNYMEAHGTGTVVGDVIEAQAIDEFFCDGRKEPLLIGTVKSNLGHTESASGLVSLTKIIIAIRTGLIPGNLHYENPDPKIKGICEGRLKLMVKNTPLPNGLIGVDAFGWGGTNAHAVVRPHTEKRNITNDLPYRLVNVSGRTKEAVELMLESIVENKTNEEFLSLIDHVYNKPIDNQTYRGYAVLSDKSHYEINQSSKKRPIWFVYSGMGSQWPEMAKDLMKIDVFRNTMQKCAAAVKPYGIDLENVVTNGTKETFDNLINTFTAITAVSVSLTDVLTSMKIEPSGFMGHSLGEVGCAYADGLITAEQATLIAYARGYAVATSKIEPGLMAAVGLSAEECSKILPEGLFISCDNSEESVTISGPDQAVTNFCQELTTRGIFNKVVNTANRALHCPLLAPAASKMYNFVKNVLPDSKLRSKRWLSSTVPESEWDSKLGRYNSAEYHYHNYLNRVEFRQLLKYVPKDAILIEVAPMGLLQSILRRALDKSVTLLSLVKPGEDNFDYLLSSVGKLYMNGGSLDLTQFYKTVSFPVSIDTPMISSLIKWDHSVKWHVPKYNAQSSFGSSIDIDMNDQSNHFLEGHAVDGRVVLPASGYLFLVWTTFAKMLEKSFTKLPVIFKNVKTIRQTFLPRNSVTSLVVNICRTSGYFEIHLKDELVPVSTGWIFVHENVEGKSLDNVKSSLPDQYKLKLTSDDFYKFMHLRGFNYDGLFLGVQECDFVGRSAVLKWNENWIAFIDTIIHYVLGVETREHCLPTRFEEIVIHPEKHFKCVALNTLLKLSYDEHIKSVKCGGIEIKHIVGMNVKRHHSGISPVVGRYAFVKNYDTQREMDSFTHSVNVVSQIVTENSVENLNIKIAETDSDKATEILRDMMERVSFKRTTFHKIGPIGKEIDDHYDLLITQDIKPNHLKFIENCSNKVRFIFGKVQNLELTNFEVIYQHVTESGTYVLLRRWVKLPEQYTVIKVNNNNFKWIEDLKAAISKEQNQHSRIYLVNEDFNSGIVGLFNSIRQEHICPNLRIFFIRGDKNMEPFSLRSKFYLEQVRKDMTVNVYQNNSWGTYRFLPLQLSESRLYRNACLIKDNNNVQWMQSSPYLSDRKVTVKCASINELDFLVVNGKAGFYPGDEHLGLEYSGVNKDGITVMGLVQKGAVATSVEAHPYLTWNIPSGLTFEEAATIPLAYTLSYYGIFVQARFFPNDTILIHNCTDGVSLAAVALTLTKSSSVYFVGNSLQRDLLKKHFPKLQEENMIIDSEDNPFYEVIMKKTNGRGVDIIFNCHSSELLRLSTNCVAKGGCFVEIDSDIDMSSDFVIDDFLDKHFSYHNITISDIFKERMEILSQITETLGDYLKEEIVVPLKYRLFDKDDIESVFKHVYNRREKSVMKISSGPENKILALPRTYMDPNKCYVLVGGLGGFGVELANWLVERGATKLVLNSRRGITNGYQTLCLHKWKNQGVTALVDTSDSSNYQEAENLLNVASRIGPVGGIFNSALVLRDEMITQQTAQDFADVLAPKTWSTQNMDILSRKLCPNLDYFVVCSSITSSIGNTGQTNYGFANSAMERICEKRQADGLPGLAIEWGPIGDVGVLAGMKGNVKMLEASTQPIRSILETLDKLLQQDAPVVISCVCTDDNEESSEKKTLIEAIAGLFGIKDVDSIDDSKTLSDLGMDSLLGYEIKYILSKEYNIELGINEIRSTTVEQLKNYHVDV